MGQASTQKHKEEQMRRIFLFMISIGLTVAAGAVKAANLVTATSEGWSVTVDGAAAHTSHFAEGLGTVLDDVRLNLRDEHGLEPWKNWSVATNGRNQLSIRTAEPPGSWLLDLRSQKLEDFLHVVRCRSRRGSARPPGRIVARLLDPQGTPVNWMMTPRNQERLRGLRVRAPLLSSPAESGSYVLRAGTGGQFQSAQSL